MDRRVGEKIGYATITIAAFVVGVLVGGRACGAPADPAGDGEDERRDRALIHPDDCPTKVIEERVEAPPKIIYQCPPEPDPEPSKGTRKVKKPARPEEKLPDPPELDPLARKRLLAWVRDQSDDLKPCRDDSKDVYRVAVIMHLDAKTRKVKRVDVNSSRGELPGSVGACLKRRILTWKPPTEFIADRTQLVFGLNL